MDTRYDQPVGYLTQLEPQAALWCRGYNEGRLLNVNDPGFVEERLASRRLE